MTDEELKAIEGNARLLVDCEVHWSDFESAIMESAKHNLALIEEVRAQRLLLVESREHLYSEIKWMRTGGTGTREKDLHDRIGAALQGVK